jgi:hypothetical protein
LINKHYKTPVKTGTQTQQRIQQKHRNNLSSTQPLTAYPKQPGNNPEKTNDNLLNRSRNSKQKPSSKTAYPHLISEGASEDLGEGSGDLAAGGH